MPKPTRFAVLVLALAGAAVPRHAAIAAPLCVDVAQSGIAGTGPIAGTCVPYGESAPCTTTYVGRDPTLVLYVTVCRPEP